MSTLDTIAQWVLVDYLNRSGDTATQTICRTAAASVYRTVCAKVPFDELMATSGELALVAGTAAYTIDSGGWAITPDLRALASVRISFSSTSSRRLRRSHVRVYDAQSYSQSGKPATYARWGNQLVLNPAPDSASYTVRLRYWSRPTITDHSTTLVTPVEWDALLQWETAYQVLYNLDQIDKAMTLVQPAQLPRGPSPRKQLVVEPGIIPRLWNDLLSTVNQQENVDEDFNINPMVRSYSVR